MLKKTMTYVDYDGETRTDDLYFNLSKAELVEMQLSETGGLEKHIRKIVAEKDGKRIVELFKTLILKSYGVKSADGKRFIKSKELSEEFAQTEAYSDLFMELSTDADKAAAFVRGIIPATLSKELPATIK